MRPWMRTLLLIGLVSLFASDSVAKAHVFDLHERWRLGGDSESDSELFGVLVDLVEDAQGHVHLLDLQLDQISVFDPQGRFLFAYGQSGEGPGDLSGPRELIPLSDDRMGVFQPQPLRISIFDLDGTYLNDLRLAALDATGARAAKVRPVTNGYLMQVHDIDYNSERMINTARVIRCDETGAELGELASQSVRFDFAKLVIREGDPAQFLWTVSRNGRLYLSDSHEYDLASFDANGRPADSITRNDAPRLRDEEELAAIRDYYLRGGGAEGADIRVHPHHRAIRWLAVGPRNRLWVLSDRGSRTESALGCFDLFDEEGRFLKSVVLQGEGHLGEDRFFLHGERLYVLRRAEDAFRAWQAHLSGGLAGDSEQDEEPEAMSVIAYDLPEEIWR